MKLPICLGWFAREIRLTFNGAPSWCQVECFGNAAVEGLIDLLESQKVQKGGALKFYGEYNHCV